MVELDSALRRRRELGRARPFGDQRREVDDFEDPLERHQRGQHVDPGVRQLRERLVDLAHVHHERRDRADADRAVDHQVAADEVHDGGADRGNEGEPGEEHA